MRFVFYLRVFLSFPKKGSAAPTKYGFKSRVKSSNIVKRRRQINEEKKNEEEKDVRKRKRALTWFYIKSYKLKDCQNKLS